MGFFGSSDPEKEVPRKNEEETPEEYEEEDDEDNEEEYSAEIECGNCNEVSEAEIAKGITIKDYFRNKLCGECGCQLIQKE